MKTLIGTAIIAATASAAIGAKWNPWPYDGVTLDDVITESGSSKYSMNARYGP